MPKHTRTLIGLSLALAPLSMAQTPAPAPAPAPTAPAPATPTAEEIQKIVSYYIGFSTGQQWAQNAATLEATDIKPEDLFRGFQDGLLNQPDKNISNEQLGAAMEAFEKVLMDRSKAKSEKNIADGKKFFEENGKKEGVVTTASGLQYKIIKEGTGKKYDAAKDGEAAIYSVQYEGRLLDGKVFDSSRGQAIDFPVNQVVPGFSEALKLMPVGSEWEVYIPGHLAYGERGAGVVGNSASLIFKIKVEAIKPKLGSAGNPAQMTPEIEAQLRAQGLIPAN